MCRKPPKRRTLIQLPTTQDKSAAQVPPTFPTNFISCPAHPNPRDIHFDQNDIQKTCSWLKDTPYLSEIHKKPDRKRSPHPQETFTFSWRPLETPSDTILCRLVKRKLNRYTWIDAKWIMCAIEVALDVYFIICVRLYYFYNSWVSSSVFSALFWGFSVVGPKEFPLYCKSVIQAFQMAEICQSVVECSYKSVDFWVLLLWLHVTRKLMPLSWHPRVRYCVVSIFVRSFFSVYRPMGFKMKPGYCK